MRESGRHSHSIRILIRKKSVRFVWNAFPESSYKDVIRDYHIEVFVPPFTDEKQFVLFNYQHRDPLDQNAEIRVLTW